MLDILIASQSRRSRSVRATAGSLLAHAAVLLAAVAGTWRVLPAGDKGKAREHTDVFLPPAPEAPRRGSPLVQVDVPGAPPTVPDLPQSPLPPVVPGPDSVSGWLKPLDGSVSGPGRPATSEPLAVEVVDEPPDMLIAGPPRYPELLRAAGVTGRVNVEAVIDTLGRPERASLRVVESAHPGFDAAALAYVGGALFRPGRRVGRAVRVLVRVPVEFRLTR